MSYYKLKFSELCKWSTGRGDGKSLDVKCRGQNGQKLCCDFESNESIVLLFTESSVESPVKDGQEVKKTC